MSIRKYIPKDREESLDVSESDEEPLYADSLSSSKFKASVTSYQSPGYQKHIQSLKSMISPEKTTPKSVPKDYPGSQVSRINKGIKINEEINETHKFSQKGGPAIHAQNPERIERTYDQADTKSYYQKEIEKLKASLVHESNWNVAAPSRSLDHEQKSSQGAFETQNPARELSAFEKANIRKNQQQRESSLYALMSKNEEETRESPQLLTKDPQSADPTQTTKLTGVKFNLDEETLLKLAAKLESIENALEQIRNKGDPQSVGEEQILREKVKVLRSELEKGFEKIQAQQDKSSKHLGSITKKKVIIKDDTRDIYKDEEEEQGEVNMEEYGFDFDQDQYQLRRKKSKTSKSHGLNSRWKGLTKEQKEIELYQEVENLRNENQQLRMTLENKETYEFELEEKYKDSKYDLSEAAFNKEKELLEIIERIKGKLRHKVANKIQKERERSIENKKKEIELKIYDRPLVPFGMTYQEALKRATFGDEYLDNNSTLLLYKGIPTSYDSHSLKSPIQRELRKERKAIKSLKK